MAFTDPTRSQRRPLVRDGDPAATFHDTMADQLRHAPWLGLSLALHALVVFLFWLWPPQQVVVEERSVQMQVPAEPEVIPDEIVPPAEVTPEKSEDEPLLLDPTITESDPTEVADTEPEFAESDTLEHDRSWNQAIGLAGGGPSGKYGNRPGGSGRRGGTSFDPTIAAALEWLRDHQDDDGRWDADEFMKHDLEGAPCSGAGNAVHDIGVTGLALLAFLGQGNTLRSGRDREVVKRAVRWLRSQQDSVTGLFGSPNSNEFVYDHAIAALAMVEAYGLSEVRLLKKNAQAAIEYLERHRNPYGAWRYQPRDGDQDVSVTGWCILAYKSAQDFGLDVNRTALDLAATFLDEQTDPETGRTGYTERGGLSSRRRGTHATRYPREHGECMTAVSLMCRYFLGQDPRDVPVMKRQAQLVLAKPPTWDEPGGRIDHYAWYYGTYALYQYGGDAWRRWTRALTPAVVRTQCREGNEKGSWDPVGVWGEDGGRVYATAILALTLQAYHRYTRVLVR